MKMLRKLDEPMPGKGPPESVERGATFLLEPPSRPRLPQMGPEFLQMYWGIF